MVVKFTCESQAHLWKSLMVVKLTGESQVHLWKSSSRMKIFELLAHLCTLAHRWRSSSPMNFKLTYEGRTHLWKLSSPIQIKLIYEGPAHLWKLSSPMKVSGVVTLISWSLWNFVKVYYLAGCWTDMTHPLRDKGNQRTVSSDHEMIIFYALDESLTFRG